MARFELATTRLQGEVTLVFTTGRKHFAKTRRGTSEKSRLEARNLQVPYASGLRPRPWSSDPRLGSQSQHAVIGREVSLLFTTGETFIAREKIHAPLLVNCGQGICGHGRACAHEDSNLTARRLFHLKKYPWPFATDQVKAGGISDSGIVDSQSKEPRPAPPSELNFVGFTCKASAN